MHSMRVETTTGTIEGRQTGVVVSYLGIPYGAPTDGPNRFKPPMPARPWRGVRKAGSWGPRSYQTTALDPFIAAFPKTFQAIFGTDLTLDLPMSETCLTLNVWAPVSDVGELRPVLFWLHGGGSVGSPSESRTDGSALASRGDVVVVSVTHRLNVLGYLCLNSIAGDEYETSGNVGHLDLVAALRWVRDNIAAFGGDPSNVTIFGESAGGSKVACLMAMPEAQGLFHKAAIQSGAETTTGLSVTRDEADAFARAFLANLNIRPSNWRRLLELPAGLLVEAHASLAGRLGVRYALPPPGMTIDGRVLPRNPIESVSAGECADVPLLVGACRDELGVFLMDEDYFARRDSGSAPVVKGSLNLEAFAAAGRESLVEWLGAGAEQIIDTYRRNRPDASDAEIEAAIRGDRQLVIPSLRFAEEFMRLQSSPVFAYSFEWVSSVLPQLGAFHNMDVGFFFSTTDLVPVTRLDPSSAVLADQMSDALIAFARSGNPNHPGLPHWPSYDRERRLTMIFDRNCNVVEDPHGEERRVWDAVPTDRLGYDCHRRTRLLDFAAREPWHSYQSSCSAHEHH